MRFLFPAIAAIAMTGAAYAQPDPHHPPATADVQAAGPGMMGMMQMMSGCPMAGRTEGSLAFLKTELKITPAQSAAWDAFAAAYKAFAASRQQMMTKMSDQMMGSGGMMGGPGMAGPMTGGRGAQTKPYPDRMSTHMQMMEGRLAAMKKLQEAARPLYTTLSPEQKKTADQILPMFTMMGGMM